MIVTKISPDLSEPAILEGDRTIVGGIPEGKEVIIHGNAVIKGNIGAHVSLQVDGTLEAENIGRQSHIVAHSVDAHDAAEDARVISTRGNIILNRLSLRTELDSAKAVRFIEAFGMAQINAAETVDFEFLGSNSTVNGTTITGDLAGNRCNIEATASVVLGKASDSCKIRAAQDVKIDQRGQHVTVEYGRTDFSPPPPAAKYHGIRPKRIDPNHFEDLGCGVFFDRRNDAYLMPKEIADPAYKEDPLYSIDLYCALNAIDDLATSSCMPPRGDDNRLSDFYVSRKGMHNEAEDPSYVSYRSDSHLGFEQLRDAVSIYLYERRERGGR